MKTKTKHPMSLDYLEINNIRYAFNHGQIELTRKHGERPGKIEGWKRIKSKLLVADVVIDYYKQAEGE